MGKYLFYAKLLLKLITKLDFSINAVKQSCIEMLNKRPDDYHQRFLLAELYRSEGKNSAAMGEYRKLLDKGYMNEKVMYGLAISSFKEHLYDEALDYFNNVIEINPNNKETFDHIGRIHLEDGHWAEAIRYFERSLDIDPKNGLILENVAYCYYKIGAYEKSYEAYRAAFELTPKEELRRDMNLAKSKIAGASPDRQG